MRRSIALAICAALVIPVLTSYASLHQNAKKGKPVFQFAGVSYLSRFSKGDMHEYTPAGQEDLNKWADMFTINYYPSAKDGEALASAANTVLGTYKAAKAVVVKTNSVPKTDAKPAEHLIVVLFPRPEFIEAAFARFRMHKGTGTSVVYSHRIYGKAAGDAMSAWLKKNGEATEKKLMSWDAMPATSTR